MKKKSIFLGLIMVLTLGLAVSCGKHSQSPVDQYVEILDEATQKTEKLTNVAELMQVQQIISPEAAEKIVSENADYKLTDKDKDKLKKSYDKLLRVAYEKTIELSNLPEELKKQTKAQIELIIEGANTMIDGATTLGDLHDIN